MTEPLSPAALAVMTAGTMGNSNVVNDPVYKQCIAAALRAAADQVVPEPLTQRSPCREHCIIGGAAERIRAELLAIADELEAGVEGEP
jgi:hypothetical protein